MSATNDSDSDTVDERIDAIDDDQVADFSHQSTLKTWDAMMSKLDKSADTVVELDLTHTNLKEIGASIGQFVSLKKLSLRQNAIRSLGNVNQCAALQSLDLYLNEVATLEALESDDADESERVVPLLPARLRHLDCSYNALKSLGNALCHLSELRVLYLVQNKIGVIGEHAFDAQSESLRLLELGANRLRRIEHVGGLSRLRELWLGKNKLTEIGDGLAQLTELRRLDLQSNRLTAIGDGLRTLAKLKELYLSHNAIERIEGLDELTNLRCLDVSRNRIEQLGGLGTLTRLTEFWASGNQIASFEQIEALANAKAIETVYFELNPIASDPQYRSRLSLALPSLSQIDATLAYPERNPLVRASRAIEEQQQKRQAQAQENEDEEE
jgi:protein phosphatase 1 regulatory subunit 7